MAFIVATLKIYSYWCKIEINQWTMNTKITFIGGTDVVDHVKMRLWGVIEIVLDCLHNAKIDLMAAFFVLITKTFINKNIF